MLGASLTSRVWRFHLSVVLFGSCDVASEVSVDSQCQTFRNFLVPKCCVDNRTELLVVAMFHLGTVDQGQNMMLMNDALLVIMLLQCVCEFFVLLW